MFLDQKSVSNGFVGDINGMSMPRIGGPMDAHLSREGDTEDLIKIETSFQFQ